MNFKEKVRHMSKMGVPKTRIIKERTPYVAKNTLKKFAIGLGVGLVIRKLLK